MKILIIPDIHLKPRIFRRAAELMTEGAANKTVCLMDIPDDWNCEFDIDRYVETFDAAILFAKKFPGTLWCWGNHDLSYVWGMRETGYSWFAQNTVTKKLAELREALPDPKQLAYIHKIDHILFLHGGLTDYFVWKHTDAGEYENADRVIERINQLDCAEMWNDDSPIWFRPQYNQDTRMYRSKDLLQVVGHTPVAEIRKNGNVLSCDVFSTYRNGDPIGPCVYVVLNTETWVYRITK